MNSTILSTSDALILLSVFTASTSILVMWLKALDIKDTYKFLIVVLASALGGFLTAYAAGQITTGQSLLANASIVYTAAHAIYTIVFRGLGLDRVLYPKSATVKNAMDSVQTQTIEKVSNQEAKKILDPTNSTNLVVNTEITGNITS